MMGSTIGTCHSYRAGFRVNRRTILLWALGLLVVSAFFYTLLPSGHPRLDHYGAVNEIDPRHLHNLTYEFKRQGPYLYIDSIGQTGNNMFEYASLYGIARMLNMTPVVDSWAPVRTIFNSLSALTKNDIAVPLKTFRLFREKLPCAFDEKVKEIDDNTYLQYYFQSWKYFNHVSSEIRQEFIFKDSVYEKSVEVLESLMKKFNQTLHQTTVVTTLRRIRRSTLVARRELPHVTLVGVHVRRGDVMRENKLKFGYTVPDVSYFIKATNYFRKKYKNVIFIVTTNDAQWVRENVLFSDAVLSEGLSAASDLAILTLCDHIIMSEGSFSWWAAYLVPGEVIYFKDWPKNGSVLDQRTVKEDYFLPKWIPM